MHQRGARNAQGELRGEKSRIAAPRKKRGGADDVSIGTWSGIYFRRHEWWNGPGLTRKSESQRRLRDALPAIGAGCRWSRTRDADNGRENREADGGFLSAGNGWIEALSGPRALEATR